MEKTKTPWWQPGISLFGELSGWIFIPAATAFFVGNYLDKRLATGQWWFFGSISIAFLISIIGIVRGSIRAMKLMDKISNNKQPKKSANYGRDRN